MLLFQCSFITVRTVHMYMYSCVQGNKGLRLLEITFDSPGCRTIQNTSGYSNHNNNTEKIWIIGFFTFSGQEEK